jgi:hypothetical protein
MSVSKQEILSRLELQEGSAALSRARLLLELSSTRPVSPTPVRINAAEALRVWETRLRTTWLTGPSTQGIQSLVEKLRQMEPDAEIEQFGFTGAAIAGSIFFNRQSGEFVGETIVDKPKAKELIGPKSIDASGDASSRRRGESA